MKNELVKLGVFSKDRVNVNAQRMIWRRQDLEDRIKARTTFLPADVSLKQRLTTIFHEFNSTPKCPYCDVPRIFDERGAYKYTSTCGSPVCASKSRADSLGEAANAAAALKRTEKLRVVGSDGLTGFQRMYLKTHRTKVTKGLCVPDDQRTAFQKYRSQCVKITKMNDLSKLENFDLRGPRKPGAYELDHKISISYGFANNIEPTIIGHICNLEMIPWSSNAKKNLRCSISLQALLEQIRTSESLSS